jgi:hypothetical protein
MSAIYRQFPIHLSYNNPDVQAGVFVSIKSGNSNVLNDQVCIELLLRIINKQPILVSKRFNYEQGFIIPNRNITGCVVFNSNRAIYFSEGKLVEKRHIPWGGRLLSLCDEKIEFQNDCHFVNSIKS